MKTALPAPITQMDVNALEVISPIVIPARAPHSRGSKAARRSPDRMRDRLPTGCSFRRGVIGNRGIIEES